MPKHHIHPLFAFLILAMLTVGLTMGKASAAVQIEKPDRTVAYLKVTYAEPMPTGRYPNRHYFELNDGSAWGYVNYRTCARADFLPDRVCRTVFWYAR